MKRRSDDDDGFQFFWYIFLIPYTSKSEKEKKYIQEKNMDKNKWLASSSPVYNTPY